MKKQFLLFLLIYLIHQASAQTYPDMIIVEGGTFQMGNEGGESDEDEQPVHTVTLNSFRIARTETTVLQWKTYCNETGREMPKEPSWGWIDSDPIVNIDWEDAVVYCDWMTDKTGKIYRLPTEAEWEYAAKGGKYSKKYEYGGGNRLSKIGWYEKNSSKKIHPVANKIPNELGIYDLSGNVYEWCQDWYGNYSPEGQTDPRGEKTGTDRTLRGGCWASTAAQCRVTNRKAGMPAQASSCYGFRVVSPE